MLWFIGLGISGTDNLSSDTWKIIRKADLVFFENFTSPIPRNDLAAVKKASKKRFRLAPRWLVEDGKTILEEAKKRNVVLLTYGDPYIATTHIELRTRAELEKIKTRTIHAASAITSLVGECGLQYYKIGKPVTVMRERQSLSTVYYTIYDNLTRGAHSILILEYNSDAGFFLDPKDALAGLLAEEQEQKRNVISNSMFGVVASRIGSRSQSITCGKISSLSKAEFGRPPHTVIIPGRMHFTESDALRVFARCLDEPSDNQIQKISDQMLARYIPKARRALDEVIKMFKDEDDLKPIIENSRLYINDAEKFQAEGKADLAVLSIGYAEGLIDALRLSRGIDPWTLD